MTMTTRHLGRDVPVYWHRPNGDPVVSTPAREARDGYAVAVSSDGHEYVCGLNPVLTKHRDGTATYSDTQPGGRRTWHRNDAGPGRGEWTEDKTIETQIHAATQVPVNLQGGTRWRTCDNGKPFDLSGTRASTLATVRAWAGQLKDGSAQSLWIYGPPGRGKSQLTGWLTLDLADVGVRVEHIEWVPYVAAVQRGYNTDDAAAGRASLLASASAKTAPVLILDDFGAGKCSDDVARIAYDLLNHRIGCKLPTVYTSNLTPAALERAGWDGRVTSRCGAALPLLLDGADYRRQQGIGFA